MKKIDPPKKFDFWDLSSPLQLDWLLMIWVIFRLLGPPGCPGGGPGGFLGGLENPKLSVSTWDQFWL